MDNTFLQRHVSNKSPFQRIKQTSHPANLYRGSFIECHFWLILFHHSIFFGIFIPKIAVIIAQKSQKLNICLMLFLAYANFPQNQKLYKARTLCMFYIVPYCSNLSATAIMYYILWKSLGLVKLDTFFRGTEESKYHLVYIFQLLSKAKLWNSFDLKGIQDKTQDNIEANRTDISCKK